MNRYTIALKDAISMTDEQFYQLCQNNPDLKLERNAQGDLIIMPPTGGETGRRNASLIFQVYSWNEATRLGVVFDSSTGFKLPNGADRSPDVAWVRQDRWDALTPEQQEKFPPLCPDFVIELLSPSDTLEDIQAKMQDYIDSGARLGWLIAPSLRRVEIYRPGQPVEVLEAPTSLSGEAVLPGFILMLDSIYPRSC
ncbi:MAG: Uma2 family endonuclease [Cyanobacteria bacterium]|nr:Uma2 family endonuclease [Cyanobacteriota bacterium]MDW8200728.1 Uma2 family endonuclease [Cyanobacteriota bacterium SKYGB_h_bin112]